MGIRGIHICDRKGINILFNMEKVSNLCYYQYCIPNMIPAIFILKSERTSERVNRLHIMPSEKSESEMRFLRTFRYLSLFFKSSFKSRVGI